MECVRKWKHGFLKASILTLFLCFFFWFSERLVLASMRADDRDTSLLHEETPAKKERQETATDNRKQLNGAIEQQQLSQKQNRLFLWGKASVVGGEDCSRTINKELPLSEKKETSTGSPTPGAILSCGKKLDKEQTPKEETAEEERLNWEGNLLLDHRAFVRSPRNYSFKEYRLELKAEAGTEKTRFRGNLWIRSLGFPAVGGSTDLFVREKLSPIDVQIREAYVDIYSFIFPWLDLRVGRQRIAWGTADRVNPTDNLNPDDLEDIWDFGRHLGSDALKAICYFGDFTVTGVFIPTFTPASPPLPDWAAAFMPPLEVQGMKIRNLRDKIILPSNNPGAASIAGLKVASNIRGYDFSLSYVYGRDDLPLLRDVVVENLTGEGIDVLARLIYPRMNILGLDMAGSVRGAGLWAEAAIFFPERVVGTSIFPVPGIGFIKQEAVVLRNRAYTKFVLGGDYTFSSGVYLNGQFVHGFLHERGAAELGNYFLFNVEWRLFHDKLKIIPLAGCLEIREWNQIKDKTAVILVPSVEYHPAANAEIVAGIRIVDGRSGTSFGRIKDRDELFLRLKYSF